MLGIVLALTTSTTGWVWPQLWEPLRCYQQGLQLNSLLASTLPSFRIVSTLVTLVVARPATFVVARLDWSQSTHSVQLPSFRIVSSLVVAHLATFVVAHLVAVDSLIAVY